MLAQGYGRCLAVGDYLNAIGARIDQAFAIASSPAKLQSLLQPLRSNLYALAGRLDAVNALLQNPDFSSQNMQLVSALVGRDKLAAFFDKVKSNFISEVRLALKAFQDGLDNVINGSTITSGSAQFEIRLTSKVALFKGVTTKQCRQLAMSSPNRSVDSRTRFGRLERSHECNKPNQSGNRQRGRRGDGRRSSDRSAAPRPGREVGSAIFNELKAKQTDAVKWAGDQCGKVLQNLGVNEIVARLAGKVKNLTDSLKDAVNNLSELSAGPVKRFTDAINNQLAGANGFVNSLNHDFQAFTDSVRKSPEFQDAMQVGSSVFRLYRAFADKPIVPNLDFNRQQIGNYFFDAATGGPSPGVLLTPVTSLVDRVGSELKSMGMCLPSNVITDKLDYLQKSLPQIDLSKLIPDFGGIKLPGLLSGIQLPPELKDKIKIQQGIDKQSRRAWLKATSDFNLSGRASLFSFGPVEIALKDAHFFAESNLSVDTSGTVTRTVNGKITADWELNAGGSALVTFEQTELLFDQSGRLKFNFDPQHVRMSGALEFLTNLLKSVASGTGLTPKIGAGSVEVMLRIAPPIQFGEFGVSNLAFVAVFGLEFAPSFAIFVDVESANKVAPLHDHHLHSRRFRLGDHRPAPTFPILTNGISPR